MVRRIRRRRKPVFTPPESWVIETTYRLGTRTLEPGTEVKITGESGRFRFVRAVTTPTSHWLQFIGGTKKHETFRFFYPSRVKTVHRIKRTRAGTKI